MLGLLNGYICLHSFSVVLLSLVRLWLWLNRCISFLCYLVLLLLWFLSIVLLVLAQIYILWLNRYISFGFAPYALLSAILCFFGAFYCVTCASTHIYPLAEQIYILGLCSLCFASCYLVAPCAPLAEQISLLILCSLCMCASRIVILCYPYLSCAFCYLVAPCAHLVFY